MIDQNKRLVDMTLGELLEALKSIQQQPAQTETKQFEYGLAGIARIFKVSTTTANRYKQSGILDPAISQIGRRFSIDVEMALQLVKLKQS